MSINTQWFALPMALAFLAPLTLSAGEVRPSDTRMKQARELLGSPKGRVIKAADRHPDLRRFLELRIAKALPSKQRSKAKAIAAAIFDEAGRQNFDPLFLAAVIENESSFKTTARGRHGEIGLMQLKPTTAQWIIDTAGMKNIKADAKTLENPAMNVRIGAIYLSQLRARFQKGNVYLTAYNMGAAGAIRKLASEGKTNEYPVRVVKRYLKIYTDVQSDLNRIAANS